MACAALAAHQQGHDFRRRTEWVRNLFGSHYWCHGHGFLPPTKQENSTEPLIPYQGLIVLVLSRVQLAGDSGVGERLGTDNRRPRSGLRWNHRCIAIMVSTIRHGVLPR